MCCDVEKGLKESSHVDVVTRVDMYNSGRDRKSMKEESSTQYVDVFPQGRNHIPSHSHACVLTKKGLVFFSKVQLRHKVNFFLWR